MKNIFGSIDGLDFTRGTWDTHFGGTYGNLNFHLWIRLFDLPYIAWRLLGILCFKSKFRFISWSKYLAIIVE